MINYNKSLRHCSQQLRRNMTEAERLLWSKVRGKQLQGYQFYRQKIIGNYIVDFCCPKANLVIELDGGQHYNKKGKEKDRIRDEYMAQIGLKVLRVSDREIFENIKGVMERIWNSLWF